MRIVLDFTYSWYIHGKNDFAKVHISTVKYRSENNFFSSFFSYNEHTSTHIILDIVDFFTFF